MWPREARAAPGRREEALPAGQGVAQPGAEAGPVERDDGVAVPVPEGSPAGVGEGFRRPGELGRGLEGSRRRCPGSSGVGAAGGPVAVGGHDAKRRARPGRSPVPGVPIRRAPTGPDDAGRGARSRRGRGNAPTGPPHRRGDRPRRALLSRDGRDPHRRRGRRGRIRAPAAVRRPVVRPSHLRLLGGCRSRVEIPPSELAADGRRSRGRGAGAARGARRATRSSRTSRPRDDNPFALKRPAPLNPFALEDDDARPPRTRSPRSVPSARVSGPALRRSWRSWGEAWPCSGATPRCCSSMAATMARASDPPRTPSSGRCRHTPARCGCASSIRAFRRARCPRSSPAWRSRPPIAAAGSASAWWPRSATTSPVAGSPPSRRTPRSGPRPDATSAATTAFWERAGFTVVVPDERYPVVRREL